MEINQDMNKENYSLESSKLVTSNIAPIFHVLSNEQQILQRTDQKAFTMLSILGVFMVFFIVHFLKMRLDDWFTFLMVIIYFSSALLAIINLVLVIVPRVKNHKSKEINPTFFGGISRFNNPDEFGQYFREVFTDDDRTFKMFSDQVYALGKINTYKNKAIKRSIIFFIIAIISELSIIMAMAWRVASSIFSSG